MGGINREINSSTVFKGGFLLPLLIEPISNFLPWRKNCQIREILYQDHLGCVQLHFQVNIAHEINSMPQLNRMNE